MVCLAVFIIDLKSFTTLLIYALAIIIILVYLIRQK
jgi:hypothetical protein